MKTINVHKFIKRFVCLNKQKPKTAVDTRMGSKHTGVAAGGRDRVRNRSPNLRQAPYWFNKQYQTNIQTNKNDNENNNEKRIYVKKKKTKKRTTKNQNNETSSLLFELKTFEKNNERKKKKEKSKIQ